jgi:RNA polymerase sigma-70 factor (family 1)
VLPPASSDEKILLLQVATGSEKAFEQLYEQYADTIYGVAFTYTKSQEFSEELVQDVFLKIWTRRETLAQIDQFSNYIFIIARNHILNYLQRKIREKDCIQHLSAYFKENSITPEGELMFKESNALIEKAISHLPPQQKIIYQLVRVQGMKLKEVATRLGLTRNTVRNHLDRAVKSVQSFVQQTDRHLIFIVTLLSDL